MLAARQPVGGPRRSQSSSWAIDLLLFFLGDPPSGYRLEIQLHEHDLGTYGTIGLTSDYPMEPEGWRYYRMCDRLMSTVDEALSTLRVNAEEILQGKEDEDDEDEEMFTPAD